MWTEATTIRVTDVLLACARAAHWAQPRAIREMRSGEGAKSARIAPGVMIDPSCIIEPGAVIETGASIGPFCKIGSGARIGAFSRLEANVSVGPGTLLGHRVTVDAGAVLGALPFVALRDGVHWVRFPALGALTIDDDVWLGANVTIARGALGITHIGARAALDAQVHVGHDAQIGADTMIAGGASIAGGACVGERCVVGGRAALADGVTIADDVTITAMTMVGKSIMRAATRWSGAWPARESRQWWREVAQWRRGIRH